MWFCMNWILIQLMATPCIQKIFSYRQIDRQTNKQTDRRTVRQTDRQTLQYVIGNYAKIL